MKRSRLSVARKALMWWFRWPGNPYVCLNAAVDFSAARAYLDALARRGDEPVSVNHLVAAAVVEVLGEFPQANARIFGSRIVELGGIGLAMPVDLAGRGDPAGRRGQETAMAVVSGLAGCSLLQVAQACRRSVHDERSGRGSVRAMRYLTRLAEKLPYPAVAGVLAAVDWLGRAPLLGERLYGGLPASGLTNPGAVFGKIEGMLFRGSSMELPQRLMHVGSVWGVSALQDEVIAAGGRPVVRPMLPVVLCFDHRLFDGVTAARMLKRFGEILLEPAAIFGADGRRPLGRTGTRCAG
ncbi:MAG: 2-oxo acid dehydrogenase subunit E2 [Deltaproteobacteria bacterium]|nr:2-oxo acid dehydrogenase subunit E2 [Deltaproteobacteria bacterium]